MNDHEFDDIKRLLRIKRHENPPPGYFRDFSNGVIGRIRRLEAAKPPPWWQRLLKPWEPSARLAWANALSFAGLGIVGFSLYFASTTDPSPIVAVGTETPQFGGLGFGAPTEIYRQPGASLLLVADPSMPVQVRITPLELSSTNPFPEGLFQLPGSGGFTSDGVRVGFGNQPR